jgi:hypothetical protein
MSNGVAQVPREGEEDVEMDADQGSDEESDVTRENITRVFLDVVFGKGEQGEQTASLEKFSRVMNQLGT